MKLERLLVPTDFTETSLSAFYDAVLLATQSQVELFHLHIVDSQDEVDKARIDLETLSNKALVDYKVRVTNLVRIGEFMMSIGDVACEIEAYLLLRPRHGVEGRYCIRGTNARVYLTH